MIDIYTELNVISQRLGTIEFLLCSIHNIDLNDLRERSESYRLDLIREEQIKEQNRILSIPIEDLDLTVRAYNCLIAFFKHDYQYKIPTNPTIKDIINVPIKELRKIRNLGKSSIREIEEALIRYNLSLKD